MPFTGTNEIEKIEKSEEKTKRKRKTAGEIFTEQQQEKELKDKLGISGDIDVKIDELGLKGYTGIVLGEKCKYFVEGMINKDKQIQATSIDLTVGTIFRLRERKKQNITIDFDNSKRVLAEAILYNKNKLGIWELKKSSVYKGRTNEIITCPANFSGIVLPRSTLLRSGIEIIGTWIDPTFHGHIEFLIKPHLNIDIYKNARLVQVSMFKGEIPDKRYWYAIKGTYQENRVI